MMGRAIVHPDKKEVIPFCPEPIRQQDGSAKNDCEQTASRRQFQQLRRKHPHLKLIIVQDALGDSGPNVQLLESLNMKYIIVSKKSTFQYSSTLAKNYEFRDKEGTLHKYRFANDLSLNGVYLEQKTNRFEWESITLDNSLVFVGRDKNEVDTKLPLKDQRSSLSEKSRCRSFSHTRSSYL